MSFVCFGMRLSIVGEFMGGLLRSIELNLVVKRFDLAFYKLLLVWLLSLFTEPATQTTRGRLPCFRRRWLLREPLKYRFRFAASPPVFARPARLARTRPESRVTTPVSLRGHTNPPCIGCSRIPA